MLKRFGLLLFACSLIEAAPPPCAISGASAVERSLWLLCDRARLLFSSDSGGNWRAVPVPTEAGLRAVYFLNTLDGFVAGDAGVLLATRDGGKNWRKVELPVQENLTSIHFTGDRGWIAGWGGVILHTRDTGRTWTAQQSGTNQSLESVYFVDEQHGWAVGWAGSIVRTSDGGATWRTSPAGTLTWSLNCVYFHDPKNGWAVGFGGQMLRSRDGGATWEEQKSPVTSSLTSVRFDSAGRGWIAGNRHLLFTEDQGSTWRTAQVDDTLAFGWILPAGDTLWAVGQLGVIRRSATDSEWRHVPVTLRETTSPPVSPSQTESGL